jgi:uncharacterized protein (DUF2141 family)
MNRQYESMTKVVKGDLVVRVWRTETEFTSGNNYDIKQALVLASPNHNSISTVLDGLPNIAAYEILDKDGNGALVYPDWN